MTKQLYQTTIATENIKKGDLINIFIDTDNGKVIVEVATTPVSNHKQ